jgi:hypothetical protein
MDVIRSGRGTGSWDSILSLYVGAVAYEMRVGEGKASQLREERRDSGWLEEGTGNSGWRSGDRESEVQDCRCRPWMAGQWEWVPGGESGEVSPGGRCRFRCQLPAPDSEWPWGWISTDV